jgi:hypothetical protein
MPNKEATPTGETYQGSPSQKRRRDAQEIITGFNTRQTEQQTGSLDRRATVVYTSPNHSMEGRAVPSRKSDYDHNQHRLSNKISKLKADLRGFKTKRDAGYDVNEELEQKVNEELEGLQAINKQVIEKKIEDRKRRTAERKRQREEEKKNKKEKGTKKRKRTSSELE